MNRVLATGTSEIESNMEHDDVVVQVDKYGCEYVVVGTHNLRNFSSLVESIRKKGLHTGRGLLKLRLQDDDRKNGTKLTDVLKYISETCAATTTTYSRKGKRRMKDTSYVYNPGAQATFKAAAEDHIYEFRSIECTAEERTKFVMEACDPSSYRDEQQNCCFVASSDHLNLGGLHSLRQHIFQELQRRSPYTSALLSKIEKWNAYGGSAVSEFKPSTSEGPPLIYGAGIQIQPEQTVEICAGFSLSGLESVLDLLEDDFDGIAYPYFYAGSKHTVFPWHIEDGGTYSINYNFFGAPKLWFGFSQEKFGAVDHIAQGLNLDIGHTSCRSLLGDHKILVADPEYFAKNYALSYDMVMQEPGDFILTFPFALHAGVNLGTNLAAAVNYADIPWIDLGMYAPYCSCNPTQVQMDLSPILKKFRPDLLHEYLLKTCSSFPRGHPREVINFQAAAHTMLGSNVSEVEHTTEEESEEDHLKVDKLKKPSKSRRPRTRNGKTLKSRTVYCPKCSTSYKENKLSRLRLHIKEKHAKEAKRLCTLVDLQYPSWKPKSTEGIVCDVCGNFIRGSATHLRRHKSLVHTKKKI